MMMLPDESRVTVAPGLTLEDFEPDLPTLRDPEEPATAAAEQATLIEGVSASALSLRPDHRGWLSELLTTREGKIEPIVHVYQVAAAPGSIRAWIYHRYQFDRLACTDGSLEVVLYDLRPESSTLGRLNVFRVGAERPSLLQIPPYVVHGVYNAGPEWASFVNMPTRVYSHDTPDKRRLPYGDLRVPYAFG